MVQVIEQQGGLFGQLGKGFGQGLAEQIPKEVDQYKLSQGLKKMGQQEGLTPFQEYANLISIPGMTPQMIQSGQQLLQQQGMRNAYQKMAGATPEEAQVVQPQDKFQNVPFAGMKEGQQSKAPGVIQQPEYGQPQAAQNNPLRPQAEPAKPWTQQRLNQEIAKNFQNFPGITQPEALSMAKESEARELAQPQAEQAIDAYQKQVQEQATDKFKNFLETKLQKQGEGVFKDITGENLINLQRGMERDLRLNPKASIDDVADRWSTKALDLAKTKSQLKTFAERPLLEKINPLLKTETINSLKSYGKKFAETGNSEEFFNLLKSDFDMSPQGAALIAYPRSKGVNSFVDTVKNSPLSQSDETSRKYAEKIKKMVNSDDSFLAIARELQNKDQYFNSTAFFHELGMDQDNFSSRQKDEISQGANSRAVSWGDISILPIFGGSK